MFKITKKQVIIEGAFICSDGLAERLPAGGNSVTIDLTGFDNNSRVTGNIFHGGQAVRTSRWYDFLARLHLVPRAVYLIRYRGKTK